MKILVIDDKAANREAATQTLTGHDLTVVDGWDAAVEQLEVRYDEEAIKAKLVAAGFPPTSDSLRSTYSKDATDDDKKAWDAWYKAYYKFQEESRIPYWDVVLSDLLMPASREQMGSDGMKYVGQEMPVGFALALLAAKNGAKYVAVVTATSHHAHPASATLDRLGDRGKPGFVINGAPALFTNTPPCHYVHGMLCQKCQGSKHSRETCWKCKGAKCDQCDHTGLGECYACNKTGNQNAKHWGNVLAQLLGEEVVKG